MITIAQLFGSSAADSIPLCEGVSLLGGPRGWGWKWYCWVWSECHEFDLLGRGGPYDTVNVHAREVNLVWIERAEGNDFFSLYVCLRQIKSEIKHHTPLRT